MTALFYTDGSSQPGRRTGFAVCTTTQTQAYSIPATAPKQYHTNNAAELLAILYALRHALLLQQHPARIRIVSDSKYAINSTTQWVRGWVQSYAKLHTKQNLLLVLQVHSLLQYARLTRTEVALDHVRAHTTKQDPDSVGNRRADHAARADPDAVDCDLACATWLGFVRNSELVAIYATPAMAQLGLIRHVPLLEHMPADCAPQLLFWPVHIQT